MLICFKFVERFLKWSICLILLSPPVRSGGIVLERSSRQYGRPKLLLLFATAIEVYNYFVIFIGQKIFEARRVQTDHWKSLAFDFHSLEGR